jgi:hypothetical protein
VLGGRCRFGGKPVCLTVDTSCSPGLRTREHLESSGSRGCSLRSATRSLRRTAARGWVDCQRLWRRSFGTAGPSGQELLRQCRRAIGQIAMPPSRLRGAREDCLQSRRGRVDSPEATWRSIGRSPRGTTTVGPFGEQATRSHFGGNVTRLGGSADSFGSQPPAESFRGLQRNPNSRAAFGPHETRGDPSSRASVRSRRD